MTNQQIANYLRWKGNVSTAIPWDDASLLPLVNIAKDNIAQAIVRVNPNYFGTVSDANTISGQQDYQKPANLLILKRLDISYTDTNPGSYNPALETTLDQLQPMGEDWYATYQSITSPLYRFDDTQLFIYPIPTATTSGTAFMRLWYVLRRTDLPDLSGSTDIETLTGIGNTFHELIGDIVVNQIKYKKGEFTQLDVQDLNQHILDELVPAAFRKLSTTTSNLPDDTSLQY
jgi:hypothetical protein